MCVAVEGDCGADVESWCVVFEIDVIVVGVVGVADVCGDEETVGVGLVEEGGG